MLKPCKRRCKNLCVCPAEYNPENPVPSHFTQVVWKETTDVGCALQVCNNSNIFDLATYGVGRTLPDSKKFIHIFLYLAYEVYSLRILPARKRHWNIWVIFFT